jgi:adenosylcobinamide amidohydrolase/ABC-type Fe3+-hydroxamate transport system substrate-binding protein
MIREKSEQVAGIIFIFLLFLPGTLHAEHFAVSFRDSSSNKIVFHQRPQRVVSLVPSITEIIARLGAADVLHGITYHSVLPPETAGKNIVGGFLAPDLDRVAAQKPDIIFYAPLQKNVVRRFKGKMTLINLTPHSIAETYTQISIIGRIFGREKNAEQIISEEKDRLRLIKKKIDIIPPEKRQRVMRIMGREMIMTPGDDSFQNEYIRAAGGITPQFGRKGAIIPITKEQWQKFNPQVIYGCGDDRQILDILKEPGWQDVEAVRNNRILFFPCDLTCRAATHVGYFVSWLAAGIYGDSFGDPKNFVLPERVVARKPLTIDLDYVQRAEIIESDIKDFRNKTLALHFAGPMSVVSTLEGQRDNINTVANHYFPPPSWGLGHQQGLAALRDQTMAVLGFDPKNTSMLFTGADMDNIAIVGKKFRDMEVMALVTAGVTGNAVRMSFDTGSFYEPDNRDKAKKPGTINIILLSNMKLSYRAMSRAIISATEAKTAALQDMDIRSSFSRSSNQATGTGTDNIIVVQGRGEPIDSTGGHTKMGELMARAVYDGVQKAVHLQNGIVPGRSIFQRLKERKIDLYRWSQQLNPAAAASLQQEVEEVLMQKRYADFLKAVMAVSDDYEHGLIEETGSIDTWCQAIASEIAGHKITVRSENSNLPPILTKGIAAIYAGIQGRDAAR